MNQQLHGLTIIPWVALPSIRIQTALNIPDTTLVLPTDIFLYCYHKGISYTLRCCLYGFITNTISIFLHVFAIKPEIKFVIMWKIFSPHFNKIRVFSDPVYHKQCSLQLQGGSNMTGTDLYVNKPHCAEAVRPWESEATTSTLPPARVRTCSVLSGSC